MKKLIVLLAVAAAGCTTGILNSHVDPQNYQTVHDRIQLEADPHKQITNIKAPPAYYRDGSMMWPEYHLRASKDRDGRLIMTQLYVQAHFFEWAFLDRAWSNGERLDLTEIAREVGGCSSGVCTVAEHVGINLTREELGHYAETGLSVKIEGNRGHKIVEVPAAYFQAFRDALWQHPAVVSKQ